MDGYIVCVFFHFRPKWKGVFLIIHSRLLVSCKRKDQESSPCCKTNPNWIWSFFYIYIFKKDRVLCYFHRHSTNSVEIQRRIVVRKMFFALSFPQGQVYTAPLVTRDQTTKKKRGNPTPSITEKPSRPLAASPMPTKPKKTRKKAPSCPSQKSELDHDSPKHNPREYFLIPYLWPAPPPTYGSPPAPPYLWLAPLPPTYGSASQFLRLSISIFEPLLRYCI